jgi:hypothetical protein
MMAAMLRERVFLCGQAVSLLGDGLAALAVPLLVLQLSRGARRQARLCGLARPGK